jgi:hypothetical protein
MKQIKSVLLCDWCRKPFRVKHRHYRAKFCCRDHYVSYRQQFPKPDLVDLLREPRKIVDKSRRA